MDQTHLVQDLIQKEKPKGKDGYKEIENKVIAEIVQRLQDMAHQKIQANYKVSSQQVTQAMVDEAQKVIDKLIRLLHIQYRMSQTPIMWKRSKKPLLKQWGLNLRK